ncbi:MAG: cell division protein FtsQ [Culicoidibacterales bacterium]
MNKSMTQSQKLMVFVLSMSLYGLATLFTELIPSLQVGIVEFSIEYFIFIPIALAILFDPLSAALGAATGEIIFSEIMLGQFGGLGELEKFVTITIAIYLAGRLVRDPKNVKNIACIALLAVAIQQLMGATVDILKVQFAIEGFEAVPGLPESVFFTEGFACLNDIFFSGIFFSMIPTAYLVPRLHGKIEPLLGVKPRDRETQLSGVKLSPKVIGICIMAFIVGIAGEFLSEVGIAIIDWEASWAESGISIFMSMLLAGVIITALVIKFKRRQANLEVMYD